MPSAPASSRNILIPWRWIWCVVMFAICYLSFYPFTDWHLRHSSPISFLLRPRIHLVWSDFSVNVAAYLAMGFATIVAWFRHRRAWQAVAWTTALGTVLSLTVEICQSYLPGRVPSVFDIVANGGGALLGALAALPWLALRRRRLQHAAAAAAGDTTGPGVDTHWHDAQPLHLGSMSAETSAGWLLIGIWTVAQVPLQRLPLATGELPLPTVTHIAQWLGSVFDGDRAAHASAWRAVADPLAIGLTVCVVGLLVAHLVRRRGPRLGLLLTLLATGLLLHLAETWPHWRHDPVSLWDPGVAAGLVTGMLMLHLAASFRRPVRLALAGSFALLTSLLLNTTPPDPSFVSSLPAMRGFFMQWMTPGLRTLVRLLGVLWPCLVALFAAWHAWRPMQPDLPSGQHRAP